MAQNDPWAEFNPIATQGGGGLKAVPLPEKPKQPTPKTPTEQALDEVNLALKQKDLAKPAAGGEDDIKLQQKRASLQSLETQINRVDQLYRDGLKDEAFGWLSSIGELFPTEKNRQFDTAGAGLAEQGLAAFRVPGVGAQSDTELRQFVEANKPSASDYDATIEEKLQTLRTRVDATRKEMGLPPAEWLKQDKPAEQVDRSAALPIITGDGQAQVSTTEQAVTDPKLAAIEGRFEELLAADPREVSNAMIIGWLRNQGIDPSTLNGLQDNLDFRMSPGRQNMRWAPNVNPQYNRKLEGAEKEAAEAAASPAGAFLMQLGNAASVNNLGNLATVLGGDANEFRGKLDLVREEHPYASFGGDLAGGMLAALGGEAALGGLGMAPGLLRALAADTAYGGGAGFSGSDEVNFLGRLQDTVKGAGNAAIASTVGQFAPRALGASISGVGSKGTRAVAAEGVPLTIGQAVSDSGPIGKAVKGMEDRLTGFAGIGDQINARRTEGLEAMNSKAFDKALESIGGGVGGKIAEGAIEDAQQQVSAAFTNALAGKLAQVDTPFITQAAGAKRAIRDLPDRVASEVESSIDEVIKSYFDPTNLTISGENMQLALRELVSIKRAYRNDPLGHRIGKAVDQVESSIEALFKRQAPEVIPDYEAAKDAFRRVSILEDAVNSAKNTRGVFTSAQLGHADRGNTKKFSGKGAAAGGKSPFHDYQRTMQNVLPSQVPDSGTGGRLAMLAAPGVVAGSGAGIGYAAGEPTEGASAGLTLAALLAAAYSRTGQKVLGAGTGRGRTAKVIGKGIKRTSRLTGHAAGSQAAIEASR